LERDLWTTRLRVDKLHHSGLRSHRTRPTLRAHVQSDFASHTDVGRKLLQLASGSFSVILDVVSGARAV